MSTPEIIVYRNPGEQAVWSLLQSAEGFSAMCGVVAFFVVFLILYRVWAYRYQYDRKKKYVMEVCLGLSGLAGIGVFIFMMSRI